MALRIGDFVLCEDYNRLGMAVYGTVVPPRDKHEVRQCRTTDLVVIELITGTRRISNGEDVIHLIHPTPFAS